MPRENGLTLCDGDHAGIADSIAETRHFTVVQSQTAKPMRAIALTSGTTVKISHHDRHTHVSNVVQSSHGVHL